MLKLLQELVKTGDATTKYPFVPEPAKPGVRGKPEFAGSRCIACAACTIACPANALTMETDAKAGTRTWQLDLGRCIFCARCEEVCPTGAIVLSDNLLISFSAAAQASSSVSRTIRWTRMPYCRVRPAAAALARTASSFSATCAGGSAQVR